ncbi:zinc-ribbon domain-containing protein, partial [Nostocoides australiense]|uniref:zinc-ribbon domain-containing protein n=1 Tax=Nostocoides australiense TaxID=99480 RepID=UPI0012ECCD00
MESRVRLPWRKKEEKVAESSCPACGATVPADASFCEACGADIATGPGPAAAAPGDPGPAAAQGNPGAPFPPAGSPGLPAVPGSPAAPAP